MTAESVRRVSGTMPTTGAKFEGPVLPAQDADCACPGSGQRGAPKRRFDGGFWRPCSVCGRRFLPKYGGVMPEHRRLIDGSEGA